MLVAEGYADTLAGLDVAVPLTIPLGDDYETRLRRADPAEPPVAAEPEDGLVILYTSGTTGLPKGAVVSHRAFIARALVFMTEVGLAPGEAFVAWPPFLHGLDRPRAREPLEGQPRDRGRRLRSRRWPRSSRASASAGCRSCWRA